MVETVSAPGYPDFTGYGRLVYPAGSIYNGDWKDGKWHGEGVLDLVKMNAMYEGSFKNGLRHGWGKETYKNSNGRVWA